MLANEGGFPQLIFHGFFKVHDLQARQTAFAELVFFFRHACFFQGVGQPSSVVHIVPSLCVFQYGFMNRQACKRFAQVHRFTVIGQQLTANRFLRHVTYQCFGETHQVLVIPVGRVKLHHGEFGVVPHRNAFVAEIAVDLKHPLETADQQAFQIQLGRDAQKHLLI